MLGREDCADCYADKKRERKQPVCLTLAWVFPTLMRVCPTLARVCLTLAMACLIRMLDREDCADCYADKKRERKFLRKVAWRNKSWEKIDESIKTMYIK